MVARTAAAVALVLLTGCGDNRGGKVPAIRAALEALPGVRVLDVVGWDEMWPVFGPEDIRADLKVHGTGRLVVCDVTRESITGTRPFILARVGDWAPVVWPVDGKNSARYVAGCPESVDVAPGSPFLDLIPFSLRSVRDVVDNYDRLSALIASWPVRPRRVQLADGRMIEYYKVRRR